MMCKVHKGANFYKHDPENKDSGAATVLVGKTRKSVYMIWHARNGTVYQPVWRKW